MFRSSGNCLGVYSSRMVQIYYCFSRARGNFDSSSAAMELTERIVPVTYPTGIPEHQAGSHHAKSHSGHTFGAGAGRQAGQAGSANQAGSGRPWPAGPAATPHNSCTANQGCMEWQAGWQAGKQAGRQAGRPLRVCVMAGRQAGRQAGSSVSAAWPGRRAAAWPPQSCVARCTRPNTGRHSMPLMDLVMSHDFMTRDS